MIHYKPFFLFIALLASSAAWGQNAKHFDVALSFGPSYGFHTQYEDPSDTGNYFDKNPLGTNTALDVRYHRGTRNFWGVQYSRETYIGKINANGLMDGGVSYAIKDFKLRQISHSFTVSYQRSLLKPESKHHILLGIGFGEIWYDQQEITVYSAFHLMEERTANNSGLREGLFWAGLDYERSIGDNFSIGLRTRLNVAVSLGAMESVIVTPKLSYSF